MIYHSYSSKPNIYLKNYDTPVLRHVKVLITTTAPDELSSLRTLAVMLSFPGSAVRCGAGGCHAHACIDQL